MAMSDLLPLETLYEDQAGESLPLPPELLALYGSLRLNRHLDRAHVIANLVSTLDGVVSLDIPGHSGGAEISGSSREDRMVMGLLRAVCDVVVVGAGTFRAVPRHVWTAERIYRPLADAYQQLRTSLGKHGPPLNVFVTGSGNLDLQAPVFTGGEVPVLVVTTPRGAERLASQPASPAVDIVVPPGLPEDAEAVGARAMLQALRTRPLDLVPSRGLVLLEGGPHLLGAFWAERCLNELFLTLAPQVAGRTDVVRRLSLAEGHLFSPDHALWGTLLSVKRRGSHLFLRYAFDANRTSP